MIEDIVEIYLDTSRKFNWEIVLIDKDNYEFQRLKVDEETAYQQLEKITQTWLNKIKEKYGT